MPTKEEKAWFKTNNKRRIDLIYKRLDEGPLSLAEKEELIILQDLCGKWMSKHYPIDMSGLEKLEKALEKYNERQ